MGIRVQYAPSAALVGKAALTAGQGDFGRFAAQMGQANADRAQRERMQHAGFSFQADRDRFQAAQQAMRAQEAQAFEMDRLAAQQDFSILQQQAQVDAQRERDSMLAELDLNTRTQVQEQEFRLNQLGSNVKLAQDKDRIEYEFTQQEKAHNAKVQRAEQWVDEQVAKYSLSPDEALAMKAQLQGIKKPPTAKPFDAQEVMGKHLVDIPGYPGMKMWINPDGTKDDVRPPQAMISGGEFAAVIKSLSTTDLNGNTILPSEEVVRKYFGLYNKAAGNDTGFGLPGRAFAAGVGGEAGVDALAAPAQQGPAPGDPTAAKHLLGLLGAGGPQAAPQGWTPDDQAFMGRMNEQTRAVFQDLSTKMGVPPTRLVHQLPQIQGEADWNKLNKGDMVVYKGMLLVK